MDKYISNGWVTAGAHTCAYVMGYTLSAVLKHYDMWQAVKTFWGPLW